MKVTKLGHCCLVIDVEEFRILTDPGNYSTGQDNVKDIDLVLITHEHQDHLHIDSLKKVLKNNSGVKIATNKRVGKLLDKEGISYELIEDGEKRIFGEVLVEGYGKKHADIYATVNPVDNTGFFINNHLFYPGDAFTDPGKHVDVLALPVAGPWVKISEAIDYALKVKPGMAFPVHDGNLKSPGVAHRLPGEVLKNEGIGFMVLEEGKETEV